MFGWIQSWEETLMEDQFLAEMEYQKMCEEEAAAEAAVA